MGGKIGVLVEVNCESDFVARTDDFQSLTREIAMHIAAANPQYVRREDVPADVARARARASTARRWKARTSRPPVIDKIVEGKLNSFYEQVCLLDQPSIRDPKVTIGQLVQEAIAQDRREHRGAALRAVQARRNAPRLATTPRACRQLTSIAALRLN